MRLHSFWNFSKQGTCHPICRFVLQLKLPVSENDGGVAAFALETLVFLKGPVWPEYCLRFYSGMLSA
ncbi:hypothetical protein [Pedomonas mirosovicensis]|uniref:hypothetical protein n=1 Tax=Pedomonas mirosovicensis TaxID=2908641 RepID=UPI002168A6BE|nr:hypothetical protein [Pedomonas mirosovicensis]MCH8684882.1 hypothetical protein [Pedomonas mirosovicensis]